MEGGNDIPVECFVISIGLRGRMSSEMGSDEAAALSAAVAIPAVEQHFGAALCLFPGDLCAMFGDLVGMGCLPGGLDIVGSQFSDHGAAQQGES